MRLGFDVGSLPLKAVTMLIVLCGMFVTSLFATYTRTRALTIHPHTDATDPYADSSLTLSSSEAIQMVKVQISSGLQPEDTLSATAASHFTVAYTSGTLTITDPSPTNAEASTFQTILRTVKLNTRAGGQNNTRILKYTVFENGRWYPHPDGKYHFYDCDSTLQTYATALVSSYPYYGGEASYLATISDSGENAVLKAIRDQYENKEARFSGSDYSKPTNEFWFTSGPEAGKKMTYYNWDPQQPNNSGGAQDYLYMFGSNLDGYISGMWNDYDSDSPYMSLVEWTDGGSRTITIRNKNANAIMFGAGF